jgi:signal transduction histidine kinase/putative methionine-R-sulfoxide reductase with GAF domain
MSRRAKPVKGKADAKRPLARKSPRDDDAKVRDLEKRLAEALKREADAQEQQAATAEILRVISSSPADAQPVFDAIVSSAVRLCNGFFGVMTRYDGHLATLVAHQNMTTDAVEGLRRILVSPPTQETATGRVLLTGAVDHTHDLTSDPASPAGAWIARIGGFRTNVVVPMLRDGQPIGSIGVARQERQPFSEAEIALLKTFADQAVIAIENVRLFTELQEKNRALTQAHAQVSESLEQQTATGEILRVISSSPTEVQPVFDAVAESAARLCESFDSAIWRRDGDRLLVVAHHGPIRETRQLPLVRGTAAGRTVLDRNAVHVADMQTKTDDFPEGSENARRMGFRTALCVPLMREGGAIGVIALRRTEARLFTDRQVALLKTFADQAVIAIENVRLFNETKEALDQQTASAEILRVISSSPTDVQPVFDAIAESAFRLLSGAVTAVLRRVGDGFRVMATHSRDRTVGMPPNPDYVPIDPAANFPSRVFLGKTMLHIPDWTAIELPVHERAVYERMGVRSSLMLPLLRDADCVGVLVVARASVRAYSDKEIALMQSFADQAVIAIENVRLFKELETRTHDLTRSVGELRALGEVGQAISSTLDLQTVLRTIVARATQLSGTDAGVIYEYNEQREVFEPRATERLEADIVQMLVATPVRKGQGVTGRLADVLEPIQLADLRDLAEQMPVRDLFLRAGYRALLAVPLVREDHLIGGLTVFRKTPGEFASDVVELLKTFATQSALAIQNASLFLEIEDKSRQLEAASQHKSEFLANMSHELRTPMNAILGFSEVLADGMFGEINDKQAEYLRDILESGRHLLSLINDILDLSKIEAGRMELEPAEFDLPSAIENALTLVRERAGRRGITLGREIDEGVGMIRGDERKVKQVLLNLLSNALKFTPEGGRIDVRAAVDDGIVEVSVADTGVGIAPEDQEAVFEEFRQVGTADKKVEGTGLGLALSRKFIELHGGRIWVKSQVGQGSTFTFTLPVRCGDGAVPSPSC